MDVEAAVENRLFTKDIEPLGYDLKSSLCGGGRRIYRPIFKIRDDHARSAVAPHVSYLHVDP